MTGEEALKTLERRYKKQNDHIRRNYDRVSVTLPKGSKQIIVDQIGESVNGYINSLVLEDFKRRGISI